ncbi:hypothetical protein MKW94_010941 [Papaver nudicaule]|uniref:Ribosomal protein S19 n=1 Tax=Papaver nudicaule TaxID=74823 RepID=A0AA41RVI1_PAPNU|nr:hypothetical protein [Papaver nudicaule]
MAKNRLNRLFTSLIKPNLGFNQPLNSIIKQQDLIKPNFGFLQREFSTSNLPNKGEDNNVRAVIVTWSRSSTIIPCMVGTTVAIHNGKDHIVRTFHGHTIKGGNEKGKKGGSGDKGGGKKGGRVQRPKKTLKELLMKRKNVKVMSLRGFLKSKGEIEKKGTRWGT